MSIFFHNFAQFIFEINKLMKKIFAAAILLTISLNSLAQSGTNSPYSQFGLGTLAPQSTGFNRGMNGLAYGFHEHNQINHQNPASYSSLDSLTFIFDAGVSLQRLTLKRIVIGRMPIMVILNMWLLLLGLLNMLVLVSA